MIAGAFSVLGFAPFSWFAASIGSIITLYWLVLKHPSISLKIQVSYGFGLFGVGISWVYNSVSEFGTPNTFIAVIITLGLVVVMTLFWIIPWLIWRRYFNKTTASSIGIILCFASLWIQGEWIRSWLLTGFPWLFIGYSTIDTFIGTNLKLYAPWLGIYGVSFVVVVTSLLIFHWLKTLKLQSLRYHGIMVITLLSIWFLPLLLPQQTQPLERSLTFALVQPNISQHQKWQPNYRSQIIDKLTTLTSKHFDRNLIVWPEAAIPYAFPKDNLTTNLNHLTQNNFHQKIAGTHLISGVPTYDPNTGIINNSLVQLGKTSDYYDKVHLVPFGEYIPLQSVLNSLLSIFDLPLPNQRPGTVIGKQFHVNGYNVAPNICYEIAYPDLVARQGNNANLILTVSNDTWFGRTIGPHQHMQMAQMRALENAKPLLRTTNNGITAVVNHHGAIIAQLEQFTVDVLPFEIIPRQGNTFFTQTGSAPVLLVCMLIIFINISNTRRKQ